MYPAHTGRKRLIIAVTAALKSRIKPQEAVYTGGIRSLPRIAMTTAKPGLLPQMLCFISRGHSGAAATSNAVHSAMTSVPKSNQATACRSWSPLQAPARYE